MRFVALISALLIGCATRVPDIPLPTDGLTSLRAKGCDQCAISAEPKFIEVAPGEFESRDTNFTNGILASLQEFDGVVREIELLMVLDAVFIAKMVSGFPELADPAKMEQRVHQTMLGVNQVYMRDLNLTIKTQIMMLEEDPEWILELEPLWGGTTYKYQDLLRQWVGWATKDSGIIAMDPDCVLFVTGRKVGVAGAAYPNSACRIVRGGPGAEGIPGNENASKYAFDASGFGVGFVVGLGVAVISHEIGHMIGMGHDPNSRSIMSRSAGNHVHFSEYSIAQAMLWLAQEDHSQCIEPIQESQESADFIRGDANRDGSIGTADALMIMGYVANVAGSPPVTCEDACDFNDDGVVGLNDGVALLQYKYNGGAPPKPPVGVPGPDPTPDTLGCDD